MVLVGPVRACRTRFLALGGACRVVWFVWLGLFVSAVCDWACWVVYLFEEGFVAVVTRSVKHTPTADQLSSLLRSVRHVQVPACTDASLVADVASACASHVWWVSQLPSSAPSGTTHVAPADVLDEFVLADAVVVLDSCVVVDADALDRFDAVCDRMALVGLAKEADFFVRRGPT